MNLESIYIRRDRYTDGNPVNGEISFYGKHGKVEIRLTDEHCQRILDVVADALVEQAEEAARDLRAAVLDAASKQLPLKETT